MIVNECDILCDIQHHLDGLLTNLNNSAMDIKKFKSRVKKIDNNYFKDDKEELLEEFLLIFDKDGFINEFKDYIINYKNVIDEQINRFCIHEWVNDLIDITPDRSQYITYCKICEVTQK
jgi:hypothetical protein